MVVMKNIDIRATIPKHKTKKPAKRNSATHIVVHTTGSNNQDPNNTALYHVTPSPENHISKTGAPTLCYSDFITKTGTIYHCVSYTDITWHAGLYNTRAIGIVLAYKGQDGLPPPDPQYAALLSHLTVLCLYLKILPGNIIGHREVPGMYTLLGNGSRRYKKSCPGLGLNLDNLRHEVTGVLQTRLALENLYDGEIDYDFGKLSQNALKAFNPFEKKLNVNWQGYNA